jgi:hypothetical protein
MHFDERAGIYYIVEDLGAPAWQEDVIFDISFRRYRTPRGGAVWPRPPPVCLGGRRGLRVPGGAGPPGAPDCVVDPPAEAGAACAGTGRAHGRALLDPAERVRGPGPGDAVVGPGGPDPARPGAVALLRTPGATVGASAARLAWRPPPGEPPCRPNGSRRQTGCGSVSTACSQLARAHSESTQYAPTQYAPSDGDTRRARVRRGPRWKRGSTDSARVNRLMIKMGRDTSAEIP